MFRDAQLNKKKYFVKNKVNYGGKNQSCYFEGGF